MTKILAIGAHPDDIEFGCGALLIKEVKRGNKVRNLVLSLGEAGTNGTPESREQESRAAAKIIGAEIEFLDFGGDCHLEYIPKNVINIAGEIRKYQPDIVLAPMRDENQHPDHSVVGKIARDAVRLAGYGGLEDIKDLLPHAASHLYYYSVTRGPVREPDLLIDVSEFGDDWRQTILAHASQMKTKNYEDLILLRARYRGAMIGVELAQGLWLNEPVRVDYLSDLNLSSRNF
jgi:bacillithiol biosynthesis deacetylase BshB1